MRARRVSPDVGAWVPFYSSRTRGPEPASRLDEHRRGEAEETNVEAPDHKSGAIVFVGLARLGIE